MIKLNKKIGIVMTYFDRQYQLNKTLETINNQKNDDVFVVIVDDNSDEDIILPYCNFDIKIIKIGKEKQWTNPEPAYNTGFFYLLENTTCEIIISQNAECYHVGEVIECARLCTTIDNYITFGCYGLNREKTFDLSLNVNEFIKKNDVEIDFNLGNGWYNHPIHRPIGLEFCSSIHRDSLIKINGYDERLSISGIGYGDNYMLHRIKLLNLRIDITSTPFVVHQWHGYKDDKETQDMMFAKNYHIYKKLITENVIRATHIFTKDLC